MVCCPFCPGGDKGYHLSVNPYKNAWHCWKCDESGAIIDLIMSIDNITALTAARLLNPRTQHTVAPKQVSVMPEWYAPLLPIPSKQSVSWKYCYSYCKDVRGMTDAQIEGYGFGYALNNYKMLGRVIIPIERGYYQARSVIGKEPKYVNPDVPKGDRLFNHKILGAEHIAICEGVISAIAASKTGEPPAVALLGKTANEEQIKRIVRSGVNCVDIAFDAGTEFNIKTLELAKSLHSYDILVRIRFYSFGDPDECSEYTIQTYNEAYNMRARLQP
jgi:DNA primase